MESNEYLDKILEQKCKQYRIEKEQVLKVYDIIEPILDDANRHVDIDAVIESREIMEVARRLGLPSTTVLKLPGADVDFQNHNTWIDIYYKNEKVDLTEKERLVLDAITYVVVTENLYHHRIVDILCYALVNKTNPPAKEACLKEHTTFEDISSKVELAHKVKFLPPDCSELINVCDLDLRNSIAHMRFGLVPELEMVKEKHETPTSYNVSTSVRAKSHSLHLLKKENKSWKNLDKKPINPKEKLTTLMKTTHVWHVALLQYQNAKWIEKIPPEMRNQIQIS